LTAEERKALIGMVIAIHSHTGEILASAPDAETLERKVALSHEGQPWRLMDGPTGDPQIHISELDCN